MKYKIAILSSLLCLYGTFAVHASDCMGDGCDIKPMVLDEFEIAETQSVSEPMMLRYEEQPRVATWMESDPNIAQTVPAVAQYSEPITYIGETQIPMRSVKTLSIKPVPEDRRTPLWDGTYGKYVARPHDKTVDWRDGIPIWDDSISHYKYKDFSDWYLEPTPEIYLREVEVEETINPVQLYNQNMADAATTHERIEELLAPRKPTGNIWFDGPRPEYTAQDMTVVIQETFGTPVVEECDDGCPFDSETECVIWRRKPIVRETVSPRSPKIRDIKMDNFISAYNCSKDVKSTDAVSAPLLDRYKMLMRSAQACCTDGLAYTLRDAGASDGLIYKFMADDANFYGLGSRCLMMTDQELDSKYPNTATAVVAADVRNGCLCRGRQWFQAMLAPFKQAYELSPEFAASKFSYTYKDGLQREITVSINEDVQNVLKQLEACP